MGSLQATPFSENLEHISRAACQLQTVLPHPEYEPLEELQLSLFAVIPYQHVGMSLEPEFGISPARIIFTVSGIGNSSNPFPGDHGRLV